MGLFKKCKMCDSRQCYGHSTNSHHTGKLEHIDDHYQTKRLKPAGHWSRVHGKKR